MKQHITEEQLNELGKKAKRDLFLWYTNHVSTLTVTGEPDCPTITPWTPLLNIGQMIEFLDEHSIKNWEIRMHKPGYDVNYPDSKTSPDFEDYQELCDALWEAVKEIL